MPHTTYHVVWEIDVAANGPVDAAVKALQIQKDWSAIARTFDVINEQGKMRRVDLHAEALSLCDECASRDGAVKCADGAMLCKTCFNKGLHA